MHRRYLALVSLCLLIGCRSQNLPEKNTAFSASPLLVLKSEYSVVQDYSVNLQIHSVENATYQSRKVTTVLHPEAHDAGKIMLPYGGFQEIIKVEGAIYTKEGELVRRLSENDGMDVSLSDSYSLYEDTRVKIYELYHDDYPYTVVYDYEIALNGLLNVPTFFPQARNEHVEHARLEVRTPRDLKLNYRSLNLNNTVSKHLEDTDSVFVWDINDLKPLAREPKGRSFSEATPKIMLAAETFKMADSKGKLDSWNNFGNWYYSLTKGRNELPESVKKEVTAIFNKADDRIKGIKELYAYMQDKTRYVSIQLGIGGWQPFEAMFVEEKGYGDCKALTNYMQAIMNFVGVKAYPVLINNGIGNADIITDFPSNQFNHVILWIPEADTIWLESTSQTIPFNYIGYSNSDRHGLAVTPDSSFLIKTPKYDHRTNRLSQEMKLKFNKDGNAEINIRSSYSGYYLDELIGAIADKSESGRRKWAYEQLPFDSFNIDTFNFSDIDKRKTEPVLSFEISNVRFASKTGSRLFVPVNKINRWDVKFPAMAEKRNEDVHLKHSFREENRTTFVLPDGYLVEAMPKSVELKTDFSSYCLTIEKNNNVIEISRVLEVTEKVLPAEKYDELREFHLAVDTYDSKNIVLKTR